MNFLKNLFKKKEKPQQEEKELDIKPLIDEFISSERLWLIKSRKIVENAGFILNTLFESTISPKMGQMEIMGLFFKIKKKVPMNKEAASDIQKLLKLFLKFLEEKGLLTDEMKNEMSKEIGFEIPQTVKRETPKIGRNSPCSCGSGKKYKLCCGR
ncbi:MAG: SEC-C metal-binding domain-containing protein [bacterium]